MKRILVLLVFVFVSATTWGQDQFHSKIDHYIKSMSDYLYIHQDTILISYQAWTTRESLVLDISKSHFSFDVDGNKIESSKVLGEPIVVNDTLSYQGYIDNYKANWVLAKFSGQNKVIGTFYNYKENIPVVSYDLYATRALSPEEISQYVLDFLAAHRPKFIPTTVITIEKYDIEDDTMLKAYIKRIMQPKKR